LALIVDGKVALGVMGCPNLPVDKSAAKPKEGDLQEVEKRTDLGVIFTAAKGTGAFQVSAGLMSCTVKQVCTDSLSSFLS
jgi:3'(2'), 5'-bisphosphate nucleotidase